MAFDELPLKISYDDDEDKPLEEFFIPVLKNAKTYDRLAGFFTSTTFAIAAEGMASFIENGGKMRLVTSSQFSEEDFKAMSEGTLSPDEIISRKFIKEFNDIKTEFVKDHVSALAWMIANNRLEIKIAIPLKNGQYFTGELDPNSIYHQKVGIFFDGKNRISFSGSVNETAKGWSSTGNVEEFKVFCDWKEGQKDYCYIDFKKFEKFWNASANKTKIFDLPSAIKEHLIKIAPSSEKEVIDILNKSPKGKSLYDFQQEACDKWFSSNKIGILEMATGTGKTITSIECIKRLFSEKKDEQILVVITCPQLELVKQWYRELMSEGIESITAYGKSLDWHEEVIKNINFIKNQIINHLVIITTNIAFSSTEFINMIKDSRVTSLLIADEVHSLAEKGREGLIPEYDFRLALSATPKRYFDDEGTFKIFNFFGEIIFTFTIEQAIPKFLTPYELKVHEVIMTHDEFAEYKEYSKKLAIQAENNEISKEEIRKFLSIKRSTIIKKARNKLVALEEMLSKEKNLKNCLIYCDDSQQISDVNPILQKTGMMFTRFTSKESESEREEILNNFSNNNFDTLVAINCLDQGIDIPSTQIAIILASDGNPIKFIQRRGRILRKFPGKAKAIIHDFIVMPPSKDDSDYTETEKSILSKELERLKEFAGPAENSDKLIETIKDIITQYGLDKS